MLTNWKIDRSAIQVLQLFRRVFTRTEKDFGRTPAKMQVWRIFQHLQIYTAFAYISAYDGINSVITNYNLKSNSAVHGMA